MRLSMLTCSLKLAISSLYPGGGAERCAAGASDRCIIAASAHTIHTHDAYSSTSSRAHFHTRIDTCAGTCADTHTETPVSAHRDTHVHARTQARVGKEVSESNVLLLCDISHTHAHPPRQHLHYIAPTLCVMTTVTTLQLKIIIPVVIARAATIHTPSH